MELVKISISNYRSIEHIEVDLKDRCKIFLGINETGKTNILRAISAISKDFKFDFNEDAKMPVGDNYEFKEPVIEYIFEFDVKEKISILTKVLNKYPPGKGEITDFHEFADSFIGEHQYKITLQKAGTKNEETISNLKLDLINTKHYKNTRDLFEKEVSSKLSEYMEKHLPDVICWEYDDSFLLSDAIDITSFKSNPDVSVPLKNMFNLAGIKDIQERIERDISNPSAFINLRLKISKAATKHLRGVWKDYKDIDIKIEERPNQLSVLVQDKKNLYSFKQRSDGFKRFISFLFILSAQHKSNTLPENTIIIMDEPDLSLHPSGIRHLLKEILKISKNNYFFIATHSIFFIDKDNVERHYIVEKEDENTKIEPASYQNFSEEEVLFNALSTSVFDILKTKILFFEGWTDKEVFKILLDLYKDDIKDSELLTNIGVGWSSSASKICQTIRPLLWDENRYFLIVSDCDDPGLKEKEKFEKEFPDTQSEYFTYKNFSNSGLREMTLEDLLPEIIVIDILNKHLKSVIPNAKIEFTNNDINDGIIKSWSIFCKKNYKQEKAKLIGGYKNTIPPAIEEYINKSEDETNLKKEFGNYEEFIKKLVDYLKKKID